MHRTSEDQQRSRTRLLVRRSLVAALATVALAPGAASAASPPVGDTASPEQIQLGPVAAPVSIAGGEYLLGRPIRPGTVLPAGMALVSRTLTLGDADPRGATLRTTLTCPPGMVVAGLVRLHPDEPSAAWGYAPDVRLNRSTSAAIDFSWEPRLPAGATMTPGTVCATLRAQAILVGPVRSPYVVAGGRSLIGRWIRVGTLLPRTIALVTRTVTLMRPSEREQIRTALLSCPDSSVPGEQFRVMELLDAGDPHDQLQEYSFTPAELPRVASARARAAHIRYGVPKGAPAGASGRLGIVCKAFRTRGS